MKGKQPGAVRVEPMPSPLEQVRDQVVARAMGLLVIMLDGADDTLFSLAEKETDRDRDRYFDAMRELRLQRRSLESGFRQAVACLFENLGGTSRAATDSAARGIESLSLVQNDDLEITVALDNLARRAGGGCEDGLAILRHRLEYLYEGKLVITEHNNPLEPRQLAACFAGCMQHLSLDIRARLIVLKLFERVVMEEASSLVEEANRTLADAGILPQMTRAPLMSRASRRSPAAELDTGLSGNTRKPHRDEQNTGPADEQPLKTLWELLASLRAPRPAPSANGTMDLSGMAALLGDTAHRDGAAAPVRAVERGDLMQVLSRLQSGDVDHRGLRESLARTLDDGRDQPVVHALEQADDDVINLVAMLFDFILDDEALPSEVKALIGRLQIPLLKVAISDKRFFGDDGHPARTLLNTLARAGAQWDPQQGTDDELYQRIRQAVHAVIDHYDDDDDLFAQLLGEFDDYFREQDSRAVRLAQRLREAEEGRARAEQAAQRAREYLDRRLSGRALPLALIRLLRQGWRQVLYLTLLREGEDSEAWHRQSRIADALIWSLMPHDDSQARDKARRMAPRLRVAVAHGLAAIQHDEVETLALVRGLAKAQEALFQGQDNERVTVPRTAPRPAMSPEPEDEVLARARGLCPGQWVEIGDGETARRVRLAANIREGAKLVFINRRGIKVEEFDAATLAVAMREGTVKLVDEGALFDRALEAVIGDLRRRQGH